MKIYIICPVRNSTPEVKKLLDDYVSMLEKDGHTVHYPPRDVDQTDDGVGLEICKKHRVAMWKADEIHVLWDENSGGSKFDLGMAFALIPMHKVKFKLIKLHERTPHKSYSNVLYSLVEKGAE